MSWLDYAAKPRSSKIALAQFFPRQRWKQWTLVSGTIYKTTADHNVSDVAKELTDLTPHSSFDVPLNHWYFYSKTKELFINVGDDPKLSDIILTYKLCYSTAPVILPHDLDTGYAVEYDARIKDIPALKLELDYENAGVALESSSSITLQNTDGYFDDLFDVLIWENQPAIFYSYGSELDPALSRKIFQGYVETKSFSTTEFKITFKDAFRRLRERVNLPLFSAEDGVFAPSLINQPKRRIYGRMAALKTTGVDQILDGFALTGTFTAGIGDTTVVGAGSILLDELTPNDEIAFTYNGQSFSYSVQDVLDDNTFTISEASEAPLTGELLVAPTIPYRKKNRSWHVAGHLCHDIETTVTEYITPTRLRVASVLGFEAGDRLDYNNGDEFLSILRITGDVIVLDQAIAATPTGGEPLKSTAIREAYFGTSKFEPNRDYTYLNNPDDCVLVLDDLAEFNITKPYKTSATFTFTNGSRDVTSSTVGLDLSTILAPRDWIKADSISRPEYYEVLSVTQDALVLRTPFVAADFTGTFYRKNMTYVADDSIITVDVNGKRASDDRWIVNASQAVRDVLETDLLEGVVNDANFTEAEFDAPELLSMAIPDEPAGSFPIIRDVMTKINQSVFGALYQDTQFQFSFSVLQADKDEDLEVIREDDIIDYSASSKNAIMNLVRILYKPSVDQTTGDVITSVFEYENDFVDRVSGILNTLEVTAYLYRDHDAETYGERLAFLRSLTNTNIVINGKIDLARFGLADKVELAFDRMFKRYGNASTRRVAAVYGIAVDEANVTLSVCDFNAMFTRVPAISPDDSDDFPDASDSDVARWGYIVDNDTETPDGTTNASLGNNLIG